MEGKKKMKTYVLTVSIVFPKTHPRAGQPTYFPEKIKAGTKIHTIRDNLELWQHRAREINAGRGILSVRIWTGKPYASKQEEIMRFEEIGIQSIERTPLGWFIDMYDTDILTEQIARNDGLMYQDFADWFRGSWEEDEPKAIIHFTKYRY